MKTSTQITLLVIAAVLGGLVARSYTKSTTNGPATPTGEERTQASRSTLTASGSYKDFGTISMKNGVVSETFVITNPTQMPVTIATVLTSCMCTSAYLVTPDGTTKGPFGMSGHGYVPPANDTLAAGETRTLRIAYDPNAHGPAGVGTINRFVTVTDSAGGTLRFDIKAVVTP